jgi:transcriptional regulator with XRE-family HTH domain
MSKPFKNLVAKMSPEAQQRASARTREMLLEMNLQELRQRCAELTQEEVATLLDVTQAFVSKFERREDVLLSTLYGYIQALGGELELRAKFPGREDVRVTQFEQLGKLRDAANAVEHEQTGARRSG